MTDRTPTAHTRNTHTTMLTLIGLMTAVICILGPLSIPIPVSPVPISLTNFAIYITLYILGMKNGTISFPAIEPKLSPISVTYPDGPKFKSSHITIEARKMTVPAFVR